MSYKYMLSAVSRIGDADRNSNEYYFADGISSADNGMCMSASVNQECLGRKHIFAIASEPNNVSKICGLLSDSLSKPDSGKVRIKVQYELKEMMDDIRENQCMGNEAADMSMIYIEGGNVYAAGFGQINIYKYNKEKDKAEKIVFPSASILPEKEAETDLSDAPRAKREPSRSRFISSIRPGDRYLIVGSELLQELGDDAVMEVLSSSDGSVVAKLCEKFASASSNCSAVYFKIKKTPKKLIIGVLALAAAAVLAVAAQKLIFTSKTVDNDSDKAADKRTSEATDVTSKDKASSDEAENSVAIDKSSLYQAPLEPLGEQLNQLALGITGDNSMVAYYVKNLSSGDIIQSNAYSMSSASLNNLFVMAEVYRQAAESAVIIDENVKNDLDSMITMGDNDAANRIITLLGAGDASLGFKRVTEFAASLGCSSTRHNSDLQTISVNNVIIGNYTSVSDCGVVLEKLYKGELVNEENSREMLEILKGQMRRTKIPKYLPEGLIIANKTGETDTVQNDAALVYSPKADYVVCIMVNNYLNTMDEASDIVARMSEAVYKYINK